MLRHEPRQPPVAVREDRVAVDDVGTVAIPCRDERGRGRPADRTRRRSATPPSARGRAAAARFSASDWPSSGSDTQSHSVAQRLEQLDRAVGRPAVLDDVLDGDALLAADALDRVAQVSGRTRTTASPPTGRLSGCVIDLSVLVGRAAGSSARCGNATAITAKIRIAFSQTLNGHEYTVTVDEEVARTGTRPHPTPEDRSIACRVAASRLPRNNHIVQCEVRQTPRIPNLIQISIGPLCTMPASPFQRAVRCADVDDAHPEPEHGMGAHLVQAVQDVVDVPLVGRRVGVLLLWSCHGFEAGEALCTSRSCDHVSATATPSPPPPANSPLTYCRRLPVGEQDEHPEHDSELDPGVAAKSEHDHRGPDQRSEEQHRPRCGGCAASPARRPRRPPCTPASRGRPSACARRTRSRRRRAMYSMSCKAPYARRRSRRTAGRTGSTPPRCAGRSTRARTRRARPSPGRASRRRGLVPFSRPTATPSTITIGRPDGHAGSPAGTSRASPCASRFDQRQVDEREHRQVGRGELAELLVLEPGRAVVVVCPPLISKPDARVESSSGSRQRRTAAAPVEHPPRQSDAIVRAAASVAARTAAGRSRAGACVTVRVTGSCRRRQRRSASPRVDRQQPIRCGLGIEHLARRQPGPRSRASTHSSSEAGHLASAAPRSAGVARLEQQPGLRPRERPRPGCRAAMRSPARRARTPRRPSAGTPRTRSTASRRRGLPDTLQGLVAAELAGHLDAGNAVGDRARGVARRSPLPITVKSLAAVGERPLPGAQKHRRRPSPAPAGPGTRTPRPAPVPAAGGRRARCCT